MKLTTANMDAKDTAAIGSLPNADSDQTLVLCFGTPALLDEPQTLAQLAERYSNAHVLGCSTSGEIIGNDVRDQSLSLAVAEFEHTRLRSAFAPVASCDESFSAGQQVAEQLKADDLRCVLLLSSGLGVNGSELVRGMNSVLSPDVIVTGGMAGDGDRFEHTWTLCQGKPSEHAISAVGLYGDRVQIGHGSQGGWDLFGPERVITKSKGNVLMELDGRPALSLYEQYLGKLAEDLPGSALLFPLALRADDQDQDRVTRTILQIDRAMQTMEFAGDMPEGHRVQLMRANLNRLIEAAGAAAALANMGNGKPRDTLSVAISCVGRRLILGERTGQELDATMKSFSPGTQQVGFYSYGEISPHERGGFCDLHNQTMTLTTICET